MNGVLKVTPEKLISVSSEFSTQGSTISKLTSEMTNLAKNLAKSWEGDASSAFIKKSTGLEDDIQKMIRMVQEHAKDLQEMAKAYQNAEKANVSSAGSLSSDVIV
jgi:WXG100 family type VII secretion target